MEYTNEDTEIVAGAIQSAWLTINAQVSPETLQKLNEWLGGFILTDKPYLWATLEGVQSTIKMVYADELLRDFTHMLQFHFFLRWGEASAKFTGLVDVLSWSVGAFALETERNGSGRKEDHGAIPEEIRTRLASREDVRELLQDNPWMVCLLLLRSFITLVDPAKLKTPFKEAPDVKTTVVAP